MNIMEIKDYNPIKLLNIECDKPFDWDESNMTHVRVVLPATFENERIMNLRGFYFADRLLDVAINLKRTKIDFKSLIRIQPYLATDRYDDILKIALDSFPQDRRFHIGIAYNSEIASLGITDYVDHLSEYYICENKGKALGFLALKDIDGNLTIHLAATDKKYRATGAAASLYANAAYIGKQNGYGILHGRIHTLNIPVINLFASLGATFSNPLDVFLKEKNTFSFYPPPGTRYFDIIV